MIHAYMLPSPPFVYPSFHGHTARLTRSVITEFEQKRAVLPSWLLWTNKVQEQNPEGWSGALSNSAKLRVPLVPLNKKQQQQIFNINLSRALRKASVSLKLTLLPFSLYHAKLQTPHPILTRVSLLWPHGLCFYSTLYSPSPAFSSHWPTST